MPWDFWLIFFVLGVVLPWRGQLRLKNMMAIPQMGTKERLGLYFSTITFQWVAVVLTAWRAWARGLTLEELGLVVHGRGRIFFAAIVGAATLGGLQWLNLRRMGRSSGKARNFMQALAERILPQTRGELIPYFALAVTAGLCEEFLYRGFAMAALTRAGLPAWGVVLLSSALFGMAHLYQGRRGLVSTLTIGLLFSTIRAWTGSLLPCVVAHFVADITVGMLAPGRLRTALPAKRSQDTENAVDT